MLLFAIVAMFVAGLMVGRTPEYLGKKIEAKEVKMAMLAILILPLSILGFTALAAVLPAGTGRRWTTPARTASARSSMPTPPAPATTAAPSPASPPTRCSTTRPGPRDVHRPLPDDRADARGGRLAGAEEDRARLGRHLPDRQRRCSSAC